jgi:hypothetical protein
MSELLSRAAGAFGPAEAAAILRDRRLVGDRFAGNGHRSALNPLIATHSVVMDLTAGIFWAASPPHQLGRFVAFGVNAFEKALPDQSMGEDPMLASGEYGRYQSALKQLDEGRRALQGRQFATTQTCAEQAEKDNPGFYRNAWLLAESFQRQGRSDEAAAAGQRAWAGQPALAGERAAIQRLIRLTDARSGPAATRTNR